MSEKLWFNIAMVAKNLSILKNKYILRRIGSNKNGQWELILVSMIEAFFSLYNFK